jgi:8-oxo-dGTP diphosphatase
VREPPIAAVALLDADGSVLLQLRDDDPTIVYPGRWVFPGGHGDPAESALACARRELQEETGYAAESLEWVGAVDDPRPEAPNPIQIFVGRYDGLQPLNCLEGREVRFVPRLEAAALDMPPFLLAAWDELVIPYSALVLDRLEASR